MSILDRAKSHFENKGVKRIEVPEWKDENGNPTILLSGSLQARLQAYVAQGIADTSAKMKSTNKAIQAFAMLTAPAQTPAQPAPQVTKSQLNKLRKDDLVALAMQMLNAS